MEKLSYYVVDVFSTRKYEGNPLAVVYTEEELNIQQYYDIAREFTYSETSFVYYSNVEKIFKVRSFSPVNYEVTGAGHNLLGAVCLAEIKRWDIFRDQVEKYVMINKERISVTVNGNLDLPNVSMRQHPPEMIHRRSIALTSKAIGLNQKMLRLHNWEPWVVKTDVAHLIFPVINRRYLQQCTPNKKDLLN